MSVSVREMDEDALLHLYPQFRQHAALQSMAEGVLSQFYLGGRALADDDQFLRLTNTRLIVQVTRSGDGNNRQINVRLPTVCTTGRNPIQFALLTIDKLTPLTRTITELFDAHLQPMEVTGALPSILIIDDEPHPAKRSPAAVLLAYILYEERFPRLTLDEPLRLLQIRFGDSDQFVCMSHYMELSRVPFMSPPASDEDDTSF